MIPGLAALVLLAPQSADPARTHVEDISAATHEYRITQGGTMDGTNCRSPLGGGFGIWTQTFESNRAVRLENVGDADVVDPWVSNGRNDFRSIKEIVASAVRPGMTDRERAMAIWRQETTHRFHSGAADPAEMHDPVKVRNVYGYDTCGDDSICLAGLWHAAGFQVSPGRLLGHRTSEVYFDGGWHLMDGDLGPVYLLRDNTTIACEQDLVRDHDLVKRSHPRGILDPDARAVNEEHAALFCRAGRAAADRAIAGIVRESTMGMTLRPGEAIEWRWGRRGPLKYHGFEELPPSAPARICNGAWEYRPDFARETWRKGAESAEGVVVDQGALTAGTIVWRMKSPYVFVGGRIESTGNSAKFSISWDGKAWEPVLRTLDPHFPHNGPARYEYRLKCELPSGARLERLAILNDLQMAPLALPGMVVGENAFLYTDRSASRRVRVTHEWAERSTSIAPAAPVDGKSAESGFEWRPVEGAADYHFELADREDFAWPLSSNFEKLISHTADKGQARYRLPWAGLLAPGKTYFWHVRARNGEGLWGPWSRAWSFVADGTARAVDVRLDGRVLRWSADGAGRTPARYRVYASDEQGFSVSDEPYSIAVGRSKEISSNRPANFVAETEKTELVVLGPGASNKAFYRVVAVDASGARSGPSDYAAAPRPYFTGEPCGTAKVGAPYRGEVSVIRSLGDLRLQWVDEQETPGFWDVETPRFAIEQGPSWLTIGARTGALAGTPDTPGAVEVAITATLERSVRRLEDSGPKPWNLGLGKEKTLGVAVEPAGTATLRFRIVVSE